MRNDKKELPVLSNVPSKSRITHLIDFLKGFATDIFELELISAKKENGKF